MSCRTLVSSALAWALAVLLSSQITYGQDELRSARAAYFGEQADRITFVMPQPDGDQITLQRQSQPALKFANPLHKGQADGVMWLWLDDQMPIVAASYSIRRNKELFREFTSLAQGPLIATWDDQLVWSPPSGFFARRPLQEQLPPAENARLRLTQMKRAAERFSVTDMRLMPTPLYRYTSSKYKVIDGAMFALVRANDPDILILIEAVEDDAKPTAWRYALGRMNSSALKVQLDGQEICSFDSFWTKPSKTAAYVEQWDSLLPENVINPVP